MNQSRKITEGAALSAIYLVLMLMTFYLPVINIVTIFLLPVPFIIYTSRHSLQPALVMFGTALILSLIFLSIFSVPLTLLMGIGGIAIGMAIYKNRHAYEAWAQGTLGFAVGLAILYATTQFIFDINWTEEFRVVMEDSLASTVQMFEELGVGTSEEELEGIQATLEELIYLLPTIVVMIGLVFAFLSQWASYKILNRWKSENYFFPPFREFRLPTSIIWYFLVGIILTWIYTDPGETMYLIANNLYTLPGLLLVIQGLSFVFYFTHYKKWSKALPIVTVICFALFPFLLLYPLRILGIIDLGFQLRDRLNGTHRK
ncbi:YybS family protein [Halalkalibacillus halophilus]|uniref:YybS family protein n=1 Tax=Halalkalibacillus halophilus TaxID=392827 RepID=UPI0004259367|nr:YybS family protein [Halalkalibacillus halophilus]